MLRPLNSGTNASMRGVAVVDVNNVWASGTGGTVLRSMDGGTTWKVTHPPQSDSLDFRDIAAFDANNAFVLSAGEDGRIYRTRDGGNTWQLVFRNAIKGAFFDCFDFYDAKHGIAMSDPVNGHFVVYRTDDATHWKQLPNTPAASENEGAFAASGTCIKYFKPSQVFMATGGSRETHIYVSSDRGDHWQMTSTPVAAGAAAAGIFSMAWRDATAGVAIGGNYQKPADAAVVAVTHNGGVSWNVSGKTSYVSGAGFCGDVLIATGTKGTRISRDLGMTWEAVDAVEYNAVQCVGSTAFLVGPRGRVAQLVVLRREGNH